MFISFVVGNENYVCHGASELNERWTSFDSGWEGPNTDVGGYSDSAAVRVTIAYSDSFGNPRFIEYYRHVG